MNEYLRRSAGLIIPRADARSWHDTSYRDALFQLIDSGVGGIAVFLGDIEVTARMVDELQQRGGKRLLIGADYEFGLPMRLEGGIAYPRAMALGRTHPGITQHIASAIALEARAIGVNWNFAPVCDVNSQPSNPVINTRSFGEDAATVAEHAAAFVRGTQMQGVMACAKHAPGHGDTSVDSHLELPTLSIGEDVAERREYVPFRAAIAAGVKSVMVGHIEVPFLDKGMPASLSRAVVTGLVRESWGFDGLVVSDALDMRAITSHYSAAEAAVQCVRSGSDVVLMPADPIAATQAIAAALEDETLSHDGLTESERRWNEARAFVALRDAQDRTTVIDTSMHAQMALKAADAAVRIEGDISLLPIAQDQSYAAFAVVDEHDAGSATTWFNYMAQATEGNSDFGFIDGTMADDDLASMLDGIAHATIVIFAFFGRAVAYRGNLPGMERIPEIMQRLADGRPTMVLACGSPYGIDALPASLHLYTYSDTAPSLAAAVFRLIGRPVNA